MSGILTQPSSYKRVESNLLAYERGQKLEDPGDCLVIYLRNFCELYIKIRIMTLYIGMNLNKPRTYLNGHQPS